MDKNMYDKPHLSKDDHKTQKFPQPHLTEGDPNTKRLIYVQTSISYITTSVV